MMMRWWPAMPMAVIMLAAVSCSPTRVNVLPGSTNVRIVSSAPENCEFVSSLTSRMGGNFQSYETNVDNATTELRNKAAMSNATHLVMGPPQQSDRTSLGQSGCNNCVIMTGQAFRCGSR